MTPVVDTRPKYVKSEIAMGVPLLAISSVSCLVSSTERGTNTSQNTSEEDFSRREERERVMISKLRVLVLVLLAVSATATEGKGHLHTMLF